MESIIVLGADRVGKTTAIKNSSDCLETVGVSTTTLHFSGVLPSHHSPVQQFVDRLLNLYDIVDYLFIDRFVCDTLFYENHRYQLPPVPDYVSQEPESVLLNLSSKVSMIVIRHEWDYCLVERHRQEIKSLYPNCSYYWLNQQIEKRRIEHEMYYKHVDRYIREVTLIPKKNIHDLPGHLAFPSISLDMAEGFNFG